MVGRALQQYSFPTFSPPKQRRHGYQQSPVSPARPVGIVPMGASSGPGSSSHQRMPLSHEDQTSKRTTFVRPRFNLGEDASYRLSTIDQTLGKGPDFDAAHGGPAQAYQTGNHAGKTFPRYDHERSGVSNQAAAENNCAALGLNSAARLEKERKIKIIMGM